MPVMWGSTTASVAAAATAASAAVPPALRVSMATWLASGWDVAAMPSQARTAERPGLWKSRNIGATGPERVGGGDGRSAACLRVFGLARGRAALDSADAHGESAGHIDETDEKKKEERGRGR